MHKRLQWLRRRLSNSREEHVRRLKRASRHPFMIPLVVFVLPTLLLGLVVWLILGRGGSLKADSTDIVILSYDHHVQTVPSHEPTVGALLAKLKVPLHQGDVVEPDPATPINQDDFRINIYRAAPIKIIDPNGNVFAYSAATTPRSIAKQTGVATYPEDALTEQPVTNFLREMALGNEVVIDRSVPVTLEVNGFAAATRTRANTVGKFLAEKHIVLDKTAVVTPALNTQIATDETIHVVRDGTGVQSRTDVIPMQTQYINDDSLAYGTFAIRQAGSPGQQVLTFRVTVKKGKVVESVLLQQVITIQPVTQIIARGSNLSGIKGDMARAGISPDDYAYADYIISHESGWCPTKAQGEHYCPTPPDNQFTSAGYGLCQATPGIKMESAGSDWATNPVTQLRWCNGYAVAHYGSWYGAYQHWLAYHWW